MSEIYVDNNSEQDIYWMEKFEITEDDIGLNYVGKNLRKHMDHLDKKTQAIDNQTLKAYLRLGDHMAEMTNTLDINKIINKCD
ncbi:unnamed protein product [Gordionus sp. m RMFG-2023]